MKKTEWKGIAELAGIASIVASLVFVGLELRQSHRVALAEVYQARSSMAIEVQSAYAQSERLQDAVAKMISGEPLTPKEEVLVTRSWNPWLTYFENNHFQYEIGMLSEEQWTSTRNTMRTWARMPLFQEWWMDQKADWRQSFVMQMDAVIEEESP